MVIFAGVHKPEKIIMSCKIGVVPMVISHCGRELVIVGVGLTPLVTIYTIILSMVNILGGSMLI